MTPVGFVVNGEFRNTVVTGNGDGSVMLWSMEDMGKLLRTAWPHGNPSPLKFVRVAMLSHDGSSAFSAVDTDNRLKMWSVVSGICTKYFVHDRVCNIDRAVLSSDGDTLLTAGSNGIAREWDISSGECIRIFGEVLGCVNTICADLSPDGKFYIFVNKWGEESAALVKVRTRKVSRRLQHVCRRLQHLSGPVLCVALSSDSRFVLTGGSDGVVRIWNTISGDCAEILVSSVYFGVTVATFAS